jgi:hypothetical protein
MFPTKSPPELTPEPNGVEIKIKLSEATLVKLIPWVITVLIGSSGIWFHAQSVSIPDSAQTRIEDPSAKYEIDQQSENNPVKQLEK